MSEATMPAWNGGAEARPKREKSNRSNVVDAFDVEDAGNFLDLEEDFFELLAVADVEGDFDPGMRVFADAFESANVGVDGADGGGDFGEHAGAIFGEDAKANRESGRLGWSGPFGGDAAFGLVEKILNVGTSSGMHSDAAAARDVADDVIA